MKTSQIENVDYQIVDQFVGSPMTIIAPHGGRIEFGTSEIARSIGKGVFNLYLFEGIKKSSNFDLHIASDHFDEPLALEQMRKNRWAVSIHGFKEDHLEQISIGGANKEIGELLALAIRDMGIDVEFPSVRFKGLSSENIVNRAEHHGVQLEISSLLRKSLLADPSRMEKFGEILRLTLLLK